LFLFTCAGKASLHDVPANHIRHDMDHLTERDFQSLKAALRDLQNDHSVKGYQVTIIMNHNTFVNGEVMKEGKG
jgi:hypothetical protein